MQIVKLLLITLLGAAGAACIAGVLIGRHQVKKARGVRSLLSPKERIIYAVCVVIGIACITGGVLYKAPTPEGMENPEMMENPTMMENPDMMENPEMTDGAETTDETTDGETADEETTEEEGETEEALEPQEEESSAALATPAPGGGAVAVLPAARG